MPRTGPTTYRQAAEWLEKLADDLERGIEPRPSMSGAIREIVELLKSDSCLQGLKPLEPYFVLRGQDNSAHDIVSHWVYKNHRTLSAEKLEHANQCIEDMRAWSPQKNPD